MAVTMVMYSSRRASKTLQLRQLFLHVHTRTKFLGKSRLLFLHMENKDIIVAFRATITSLLKSNDSRMAKKRRQAGVTKESELAQW